jgi:hypothetical protein
MFPHGYEGGRNAALIALNLPDSALPDVTPWTLEQVLDDRFLPENSGDSQNSEK